MYTTTTLNCLKTNQNKNESHKIETTSKKAEKICPHKQEIPPTTLLKC